MTSNVGETGNTSYENLHVILGDSMNFTLNTSMDGTEIIPGNPYELRYGIPMTILMIIGYTFVCVLGLLGNGAVILTVCRNRQRNEYTNFFLANLAVADLMVNAVCNPFTLAANIFPAWALGFVCCKLVAYFQGVSVCASVYTLMAISIERCRSITRPLSSSMTTKQYRVCVSLVWAFSFTINLPWLYVFTLESMHNGSSLQICVELWSSETSENMYFVGANLIMCYLGPLFIISVCYIVIWYRVFHRTIPGSQGQHLERTIKTRNKATKMILVVVVSFALMWLPLYTVFCTIKLTSHWNNNVYTWLIPLSQWLGASNSAINPIVYSFMNAKFRTHLKQYLCGCCINSSPTMGASQRRLLFRQNTESTGLSMPSSVEKTTPPQTLAVIRLTEHVSIV